MTTIARPGTAAMSPAVRTTTLAKPMPIREKISALDAAEDPPAVHATNFRAIAGAGQIFLEWQAPPGAVGYRIARASWDPAKLAFIPGSDVSLPLPKWVEVGAPPLKRVFFPCPPNLNPCYADYWEGSQTVLQDGGLITGTTFVDASVKPGVQYVYWLDTWYKSSSGDLYFAYPGPWPSVTAVPRSR